MKTEDYRPAILEFDVANNSNAPESFGIIETEKEVLQFIHSNLTAINQGVTVNRFMDNFEKTELRKEYQEKLELKLPLLERELLKAQSIFDEAKSKLHPFFF
jgi:hypothetical protein